ncbi:PSP1 C-terminal conserved region-domain-containing protein [Syncephalastrum racemosum]|uniref:PSP1 C-terminal conserved region-domain-containing protein n=1 Tax=Syncephalastrum racemosum TaxID=13706 RepID=A0A1X2H7G7_SYNRA|nr:PSP1 C-terminal conserved region-domain-containing protein [Syncephalastrum racemosum]
MGKGVPLHRLPPQAPLYMLEFKAGRTDFFYAPAGVHVQLGDLAIVEADRGKDIGKVAMLLASDQVLAMGIQKQQQQQQQQQQQEGATEMAPLTKADIHIKRIYRPASGDEIHLLLSKAQDEQKALAMCQQKTRQRKLPMEVVDAEYQWDRRKLTFYFVADRRIDFRELVRELFKIYKTRIWM